jgi:hypothetical protein
LRYTGQYAEDAEDAELEEAEEDAEDEVPETGAQAPASPRRRTSLRETGLPISEETPTTTESRGLAASSPMRTATSS